MQIKGSPSSPVTISVWQPSFVIISGLSKTSLALSNPGLGGSSVGKEALTTTLAKVRYGHSFER